METGPIAAVLVHVADVEAGIQWYQRAFPEAVLERLEEFDFEFLNIGSVCLEIVPADEKVGAGACGSVVYWRVADFEKALEHLKSVGATLYRGPLEIQDGQLMCQVRDPWGNCIGLRGPVLR
ncbi:glyoxalase/bleomycin resistance/dioxygenase family protein [Mesorhizobium soli]|uniref:Glyoxalase/bleomycin resistance/dioxygenase family protein n=2 Tax=Pseudaminobacter soli (ex Li et al. 2025) TaxID=1295366 RepID=A0A2P7SGP6_9HYPH|nr:glyoxalase/bleomycin resistance/dioxygenase family protein [Mesorhizobium soli]